ncbi:MAG: amino acid transporter [Cyanobacteria bacterium]|nr:amino acid transporter [Cyanobacteriota bacterium]
MVSRSKKLYLWALEGHRKSHKEEFKDPWWRVMCLTGVDYFSSMGFQPGLSFLAANALSPLSTFFLVMATLLGALPAYWVVAKESPFGQGSFAIFERLLKGWTGKSIVLVILGFAATDFIFTITMCAADATAHIVENPWWPSHLKDRVWITLVLVGVLGAVFLKGFREAIRLCVWLVAGYLLVNLITISACIMHIAANPHVVDDWLSAVNLKYPSHLEMVKVAVIAFPQLALGLSGFETGVAVMGLIETDGETAEDDLEQRIANTRLLLVIVAIVMGVFLITGSIVTTLLIEPALFQDGQPANGRALAYLTHKLLGDGFGTVYDITTVLILWFAGASGMAALLSLVPQYLPRYGMAPDWAGARRPLVFFFTLVAFAITVVFGADVDSQAGAFATGLLAMITSATIGVTCLLWHKGLLVRIAFSLISLVFLYACVAIIVSRPDGLAISLMFICTVFGSSLLSRAIRSTELRVEEVIFDEKAWSFIRKACNRRWGEVRLLAHKRDGHDDYDRKVQTARRDHSVQTKEGDFIFLEMIPTDVSDFSKEKLLIEGFEEDGHQILRCATHSVPNAIAATLLHIRDETHRVPHVYLNWTEGHPLGYALKYILFGEGETAPLTREILRSQEPDPDQRPRVHVG